MLKAIKGLFARPSDPADGYSLDIHGRADRIVLRKGSRAMTIDSELMAGGSRLVVYAGSVVAWDDGVDVTPVERDEVLAAVQKILKADWDNVEIDYTPYDAPRLEALRWVRERDKGLK